MCTQIEYYPIVLDGFKERAIKYVSYGGQHGYVETTPLGPDHEKRQAELIKYTAERFQLFTQEIESIDEESKMVRTKLILRINIRNYQGCLRIVRDALIISQRQFSKNWVIEHSYRSKYVESFDGLKELFGSPMLSEISKDLSRKLQDKPVDEINRLLDNKCSLVLLDEIDSPLVRFFLCHVERCEQKNWKIILEHFLIRSEWFEELKSICAQWGLEESDMRIGVEATLMRANERLAKFFREQLARDIAQHKS